MMRTKVAEHSQDCLQGLSWMTDGKKELLGSSFFMD